MSALTIRLDDSIDWGGLDATDADRAAYEREVADAIREEYPEANVTVQTLQIARPRVCVTTRDADGQILCDAKTTRAEVEVEETVLEIAQAVWDDGAGRVVSPGICCASIEGRICNRPIPCPEHSLRPRRSNPLVSLTAPPAVWARLDDLAARWGTTRSGALQRLVREAELPRRR